MEGRAGPSLGQQGGESLNDHGAQRARLGQLPLKVLGSQLLTIDPTWDAAGLCPRPVTTGPEQRVEVEGGNPDQRQHDGMGDEKAVDLGLERLVSSRVGEGIEVVDVQLVWTAGAMAVVLVRDEAPVPQSALDQGVDLLVGEDAAHGGEPDAIVRGQEVEEGGSAGGDLERCRPAGEVACLAGRERV